MYGRTYLDLLSRLRMGRCSADICESSIWIYLTICSQPLTAKWSALVAILHMIISYIWDRPTDGHSLLQRCEDASKNHPRLCLKYCHWIMNSPQVHRPRRRLNLSRRPPLMRSFSSFFVPMLLSNFVSGALIKDASTKKFAVIVDAGSSGMWHS